MGALPDDIHNPDGRRVLRHHHAVRARGMRVLLVLGLAILFLTWLVGPTDWAGRARAWCARAWWDAIIGRAGDKSEDRDVGPAPRWVADDKRTLLTFEVALGVPTLLVWTRPTGVVVLMVIVAVALVMAATSVLAEVGRRAESADEERAERDAAGGDSCSDSGQLSGTGSRTAKDQVESGEKACRIRLALHARQVGTCSEWRATTSQMPRTSL